MKNVIILLLLLFSLGLTIQLALINSEVKTITKRANKTAAYLEWYERSIDDVLAGWKAKEKEYQNKSSLPSVYIEDTPVQITQAFIKGEYQYLAITYGFGIKSQYYTGCLAKNGESIFAEAKNETIETPWGIMTWIGPLKYQSGSMYNQGWILLPDKCRVEE